MVWLRPRPRLRSLGRRRSRRDPKAPAMSDGSASQRAGAVVALLRRLHFGHRGLSPKVAICAPSKILRLTAAVTIGSLAGALCAYYVTHAGSNPSDFEFWWRAGRLWIGGVDPYAMRPGVPAWPLYASFFYPLPALLLCWPLYALTLPVAAGLFLGLPSAALAWRLTANGLWRLLIFLSPTFLIAIKLGQWSPLLTFGALVPAAGCVLAAKPTLGFACFAYRPTWRAFFSAAAIALVSLALWPHWPAAWIVNLRPGILTPHGAPVKQPLGALMLLALFRWRRPEARLLIAMACVPQLLFFADQFPLGLVARSRLDALVLAICGAVAFLAWELRVLPHPGYVINAAPYVLVGCYLPALAIVLSQPNEGDVPVWIGKLIAWLRGLRARLL